MNLLIVTGLSGAGKTSAIHSLEDMGYFCVDNLPVELLPTLASLTRESPRLSRVALGIDVRAGGALSGLFAGLEEVRREGGRVRILFLDASDATLLRRFEETRRRHPLGDNVREGIARERRILAGLRAKADRILDTTGLTLAELRRQVRDFVGLPGRRAMTVTFLSFGYKLGLPMEADIVMDVRFLPNPNYEPSLRPLDGRNPRVRRYVLHSNGQGRGFLSEWIRLLKRLLPRYVREGKSYLTVAVGCTGGRHRSVAVAEEMARAFRKIRGLRGVEFRLKHRDLGRG